MKRALLALGISLWMALAAPSARADDSPTVARLKELLKAYQEQYPDYLHQTVLRTVDQYFLMRFVDFSQSATYLLAQSQSQARRAHVAEVEAAWKNGLADIAQTREILRAAVVLSSRRAELQAEADRAAAMAADFNDVVAIYGERCSDARLAWADRYFEPAVMFPHIDVGAITINAGHDFTFKMPISFDGTPELQMSTPDGDLVDKFVIEAAKYGADRTIGGYEGQLVAAAVASIILTFRHNAEIAEQNELKAKIQAAIDGALSREEAGYRALIRERCNALLPAELQTQLELVRGAIDDTRKVAQEDAEQAAREYATLPDRLKAYFADLELKLLDLATHAEDDFARASQSYYESQLDLDDKARSFFESDIYPPAGDLVTGAAAQAGPGRLTVEAQAAWSALLVGDARYSGPIWESLRDQGEAALRKAMAHE